MSQLLASYVHKCSLSLYTHLQQYISETLQRLPLFPKQWKASSWASSQYKPRKCSEGRRYFVRHVSYTITAYKVYCMINTLDIVYWKYNMSIGCSGNSLMYTVYNMDLSSACTCKNFPMTLVKYDKCYRELHVHGC